MNILAKIKSKLFLKRPARSKKQRKQTAKKILRIVFYVFVAMLFFVAVAFAWFAKDLPTPSKIASMSPAQSTKLYDRTGQILLYETGEQKRTIVASDQISQYVKDATVATEDANFYHHHGFDPKAIFSALVEKLLGRARVTRGASTITQQYVKLSFLTSDRSLSRKFKELILSIELEFMYNKDQILTMYLNEIPYGNGTAGIEAASSMYYGKQAKDLTLAEAATLVGIPQSPTYYSPYGTHVDKLVVRRNYILGRMVETGRLAQTDADKAKKEDTTTLSLAIKPRRDSILAPHFAMYVLEQIANEYGDDKIQKEGLKIITTLDYNMNKVAEDAINKGADKFTRYGASNGALVAVDPKTGEVLSMIGSRDYFNTSIDGNVNVADSLRQPGSSFKPFAYATVFKKPDYSPSKVLFDLSTDFGGGYTPQNYNGRTNGPVTMRQALSNSLNIPAVKVLSLAGIDNTIRTAEDLGIATLTQRDRYGLSLVLGAGEVKPVEMAGAFGVFAQSGMKHDLKSVLKISDASGKVLFEYKPETDYGRQVLDPQIAYEINNILSDNNARSLVFGTRSALYFPNRTIAAKTGTTSDFKDAWTVGFTPSLSVAVWVGNNDSTKMKQGADGSIVAAPIFHTFIDNALGNSPSEEFVRPNGITETEVEKYSNKLPTQYSTDRTKDIFASWQVPTDSDNVNFGLKLCKGTNKLAPDTLTDNMTETKVFKVIHSERPDNPNWEGPVRGWAAANGYSTDPLPSEKCSEQDFVPTVAITSPADGSGVSGNVQITANVSSAVSVSSVEFFVDNISIGSVSAAPFSISYNASNLSADQAHQISVVATTNQDVTAQDKVTVTTTRDTNPPTISSLSAAPALATAMISWTTSKPSTTQVFYDITSHSANDTSVTVLYARSSSKMTEATASHSEKLSGLVPGTIYYYRAASMDQSGNSVISAEMSFVAQ